MKILQAILYWILQLTWGLLMTFIGAIVVLFCIIFLKGKVHKNGYTIIVEVGNNWGGLELGAFALCGGYTTSCVDEYWFQHTRRHEFGHSIQNIIWGPLYPLVIGIPSAIRYWYRILTPNKEHPDYDAIWFEGQATRLGTKAIDKYESNKLKQID